VRTRLALRVPKQRRKHRWIDYQHARRRFECEEVRAMFARAAIGPDDPTQVQRPGRSRSRIRCTPAGSTSWTASSRRLGHRTDRSGRAIS